jgi:hypothetical protein
MRLFQNYVRPEILAAANDPAGRPAGLSPAQARGGGLVAAADRIRVRRPGPGRVRPRNRKHVGSKRAMAWLNVLNERGMGRGAPSAAVMTASVTRHRDRDIA